MQIMVEIPTKLNAKQEELLREFAKTENKNVFPKATGFVEKLKKYFGGR